VDANIALKYKFGVNVYLFVLLSHRKCALLIQYFFYINDELVSTENALKSFKFAQTSSYLI